VLYPEHFRHARPDPIVGQPQAAQRHFPGDQLRRAGIDLCALFEREADPDFLACSGFGFEFLKPR